MKKNIMLTAALIFGLGACLFAGWFDYEPIQITTAGVTNSHPYSPTLSRYRIDKPSVGTRTCFTDLQFSALNFPVTYTFSILEGPLTDLTTVYMMDVATGPVISRWNATYPLCLTPGTTGYFQIGGASTTWKINASGFIKK